MALAGRDPKLSFAPPVAGLAVFGLLGYAMRRLDYPSAPLILGLVLGDSMERALRQSLMMSQGDPSILVSRPISAAMLPRVPISNGKRTCRTRSRATAMPGSP